MEELKKSPDQHKLRKRNLIYISLAGLISAGGFTALQIKIDFINNFHFQQNVGAPLDRTFREPPTALKTVSPEITSAIAAVFGRARAAIRRLSMTDEQAISRCQTGNRWEIDQLPNAIYTHQYSSVTLRNIIETEFMVPAFNSLPSQTKTRLMIELRDILNFNGLMDKQLGLDCDAKDKNTANKFRRDSLSIAADRLEFSEREILDRLSYLLN